MKTLETDRLLLRPWNPETEAEQAFEIYGSSEVMRFIGNGETAPDMATVQERLRHRNQQLLELNDGSGFWAIEDKTTGELVGTVILKQLPDGAGQSTGDWEVGWHLKRSAWGNGYATEAGRALLEYGFNELHLPVIFAIAYPENLASIRVMERLGMSPKERTKKYYGLEGVLFEIQAGSYFAVFPED
jgi:RimJ/RimL family protein N-acetyltransferase